MKKRPLFFIEVVLKKARWVLLLLIASPILDKKLPHLGEGLPDSLDVASLFTNPGSHIRHCPDEDRSIRTFQ